jgi:hypothetical protein
MLDGKGGLLGHEDLILSKNGDNQLIPPGLLKGDFSGLLVYVPACDYNLKQ